MSKDSWQKLKQGAAQAWYFLLRASLWLAGLGLMLASSGIDGTYIAKLNRWEWAGYILNAVADIASVILMFWYGRLMQTKRNEAGGKRKVELAKFLLIAEVVAVFYAWFFGWRQLRGRVYAIETDPLLGKPELNASPLGQLIEIEVVAFISSGFIPLLLVGIGWAQSLLAGRIEEEPATERLEIAKEESEPVASYVCRACGRSFATQQALNAHGPSSCAGNNGSHLQPERVKAREEQS